MPPEATSGGAPPPRGPDLQRNLRLYELFAPVGAALFWTPVFFLYLSARFSIGQVLALHALYYFAIVLLEVPSGYLSDRAGRVLTLRLAALAAVVAHALFLVGGGFGAFAVAHVALAAHFSFRSGTEPSFHYDSLAALGRGARFGDREARVHRNGYLALCVAALAGGAAGLVDLRLAYVLSLLAALVLCGLALGMREPPHETHELPSGFGRQLRDCVGELRRPFLLWIFAYVVLDTVIHHVPYEFAQPYVAAVLGERADAVQRTPLVVGVIAAGVAVVGAAAASRSMRLRRRFGLAGTLLGLMGLQTGLIAAMAWIVHPLVLPLLALRSVQPAVGQVVVNAAVVPLVPRSRRATYLSLQNLAGGTAWAATLGLLSVTFGAGAANDGATLAALLRTCALVALAGLVGLSVFRAAARKEPPPGEHAVEGVDGVEPLAGEATASR